MSNNEKLAKIAVNKSLLKEYSNSSNERIVYMNDGTEFQIQIFNPFNYTIGITFSFNGRTDYSQKMLVLRPGERIWLDRYLDNESRLLFSTYEVGASEEVKKAIKDNGNLCIKFYAEQEKKNYWDNIIYVNNVYTPKHIDVYYDNNFGSSICGANTKLYCNDSINAANSVNYCDASLSLDSVVSSLSTTVEGAASTATYTATSASTNTPKPRSRSLSKSIETGRIEEGSHSNQTFRNVNKDFNSWPFKTEYIKILPTSQKQVNLNDLIKRYCHECGRKLNQKFKFCPFCGAKQ